MDTTTIDPIASNSFYYFFSATPQVLGAILALFGFFLVFKIQALKDELLQKSNDILDSLRQNYNQNNFNMRSTVWLDVVSKMKDAISNKNIRSLDGLIKFYHKGLKGREDCVVDEEYDGLITKEYIDTYDFYNKLKKATLGFSIFTIIIILACLSVLPYGRFILCKPQLVDTLFFTTVFANGICFLGLITILYYALSDKSKLTN